MVSREERKKEVYFPRIPCEIDVHDFQCELRLICYQNPLKLTGNFYMDDEDLIIFKS